MSVFSDPDRELAFQHPPAWTEDGLCAQTDPEIFFPDKGESSAEAKKVCAACEVEDVCRQTAFEQGERYGVWGGETANQRQRRRRLGTGISDQQAA